MVKGVRTLCGVCPREEGVASLRLGWEAVSIAEENSCSSSVTCGFHQEHKMTFRKTVVPLHTKIEVLAI